MDSVNKERSVLRTILRNNDRYKGFYICAPVSFDEFAEDEDFDVVQVHSTEIIGNNDIVGFVGQFKWKNRKLIPLDGDTYNKKMHVIGFERWSMDEFKNSIDILVGDDW